MLILISMVWIDRECYGDRIVIWVDGYVPDFDGLRQLQRCFGVIGETEDADYLLGLLAEHLQAEYCRNADKKGGAGYCDYFCLNFRGRPSSPLLLKEFFREMESQSDKPYRQVLFSLEETNCRKARECAKDVIKNLNMRVREQEEYTDFEVFRKCCEDILEEIETIYVAPCVQTRHLMEDLGFDSLIG